MNATKRQISLRQWIRSAVDDTEVVPPTERGIAAPRAAHGLEGRPLCRPSPGPCPCGEPSA